MEFKLWRRIIAMIEKTGASVIVSRPKSGFGTTSACKALTAPVKVARSITPPLNRLSNIEYVSAYPQGVEVME
jgi:hypothetical protein